MNQYAVIMAGGSGQRLWPLSRRYRPKQILPLFEDGSLLQKSVERIRPLFPDENILIVTNKNYCGLVSEHLPSIPSENIIGEPLGQDTANAIGLATVVLREREARCHGVAPIGENSEDIDAASSPRAIMTVFSADQLITPIEPLHQAVTQAIAFIREHKEALFTFGIKATFAHTGLGYLKRSDTEAGPGVHPVEAFVEKPNKATASRYIRSGHYCWNSGMFVWDLETIWQQIGQFLPHNADRLERIGKAWRTPDQQRVMEVEFPELEKISIDFGVMEKAQNVYMCELDCRWEDVGSFEALAKTVGHTDPEGNTAATERVERRECRNTIILSDDPNHLIAAIGVEDLVVVHTGDATLVCHRDESDALKAMIQQISEGKHVGYL